MNFTSINPFNGSRIGNYKKHNEADVLRIINKAQQTFDSWRKVSVNERAALISAVGDALRKNTEKYAWMITQEMGKPIAESRAEINKCAWVCDYYSDHAEQLLAEETIKTEASWSFVRHDPIGCVLAIMPWNFPFWQVFRFAAPALAAGNTALLKHAPNVFGCATYISDAFRDAGIPDGVFQNLFIDTDAIEGVIADKSVKAVTLTGSERAGSAVATLAGKHLKKTVLELGGSNAFIVLEDANIADAVRIAVTSRMQNAGQSCIAAKRFLVVEKVYDDFVTGFISEVKKLKSGDPMNETTQLGPLARIDLANQLQRQVQESVKAGAELLLGGNQQGCFYEPTVLGNVTPGMPAFDEETFGPLAPMIKVRDAAEAIRFSEMSRYGLGVTIFTQNKSNAMSMAEEFTDGACFVNELVKSDPRLPFGGTKCSGYGRELSRDGMMEFVNRKTVYIK